MRTIRHLVAADWVYALPRTDLFNALNRVNYTSVVTNIEARNFGQLTGAANARAIQLNPRRSF
jgi:hypothetical protein